jgi:RND family efflux transporter MFP subunit
MNKKLFQLVLTIGISQIAYAGDKEAIAVKTIDIENHLFFESLTLIGRCEVEGSSIYYSKASGTIDYVTSKQAMYVEKGEVILIIEQKFAEAIKSEAETAYDLAKSLHDRNIELYGKGILSKEKFDQSKLALEQANLTYTKALRTYNNMIIKAPYSGLLSIVSKRVGEDVKEGALLFEIICKGEKIVTVELPENFLNRGIDNYIEAYTFTTNGTKLQGRIAAISNYVSEHGTISMKIIFSKESNILCGSFVEIQLIHNKHKAMGIPDKAILKNNTGNFIYTISDANRAEQVYIKLGTRTGDIVEVLSGDNIGFGSKVIIEGLTKVTDGSPVTLIQPENKE